ncbi:three component ABC system middle component [Oceanobacillus sp. CF4.6]|uniref:three component ABC system middle component n=1 Tax=Oceanobacillus sp. CF4.6 TaxID=3373080 RepID=UPI003EE59C7F
MSEEIFGENSNYSSKQLFNNELLGLISIFYVLKHVGKISSSTAMLIQPITFQNRIVSYINDSRTDVKSIEQLIIKKPEFFANFNGIFYSLIDVSTNSILILSSMDIIRIQDNGDISLKTNDENLLLNSTEKRDIGARANNIIRASKSVGELLNDRKENLYLQLRVEL